MPRMDGTGPFGQGAATGRAMGNCQNNDERFGRRRFCRFPFRRFFSAKNELSELQEEEEDLKNELEAVQKEIREMTKEK